MLDLERTFVVIGVLALLGAVSCGATSSTESDEPTQTAQPNADRGSTSTASDDGAGGSTVSLPARATCPASYAGAPAPTCRDGDDPGRCAYPEGACACMVPTWCGGMAPPPRPAVWTCEPSQPACPTEGTPCDDEGQSCAIGPCGFDHVVCTDGVWRTRMGPRPP